MNWKDVQLFVRQWTWLLLLGTLCAAAASFAVSSQLPKLYEAKTKLVVTPGQPDARATDYGQLQGASLLTHTYADLVKTRQVMAKAGEASGVDPATVSVDAVPQRDTQILEITVRAPDPDQAVQFANALGQAFIDERRTTQSSRFTSSQDRLVGQINDLNAAITDRSGLLEAARAQPVSSDRDLQIAKLQGEIASLQQSLTSATRSFDDLRLAAAQSSDTVSVVDVAVPNPIPVQPRIVQNVLLAAIAGLFVSAGLANVLQRLDNRILTPERLYKLTGLKVLSTVQGLSDGSLWALERSARVPKREQYKTAHLAEQFRLLWTYLRFMDGQQPLAVVLVTSSKAGEGKTSAAANLALVAARAGQRVLVVDADLRRPTLHKVFGKSNGEGLASLLLKPNLSASRVVEDSGVPGLSLLPSGPTPSDPNALLASTVMIDRIAELRNLADLIIIDSPPVLAVSDPVVLAGLVDGILLVVDAQTRASVTTEAMDILDQAGAHVVGVVLNRVVEHGKEYYTSYLKPTTDAEQVTPPKRLTEGMRPNRVLGAEVGKVD